MSGFFGCISKESCVSDVFFGTDYHSHLGTKRVGIAFYSKDYTDLHKEKLKAMVEQIRKRLDMTSLMHQKPNDLVEAIGLPKEKLRTHCWDGSSYY